MDLRVTSETLADQAIYNAQRQSASLAQLQEQASSGNRIIQPSDDPAGEVTLLTAQERNQQLGSYLTNTQQAQAVLNASASAMQNANDILTQANQLALQANNSTNSSTTLQSLATQVNALLQQMLSTANTQQGGNYLFSGTASQTQPFLVSTTNGQGEPESITYAGSNQQSQAVIGDGQTVTTLYAGNQVFQQNSGTSDVFQALINLRDTLENSGGMTSGQLTQALSTSIGTLSQVRTGVQNALGAIGTAAQSLGTQVTQLQQVQLAVQQQISNVGGADLSQVLVNLQSQQNLLYMTLYSASQLMNVSLLNFLH
jgi:flagellar hook-associated protein 3 FlgL